MWLPLWASLHLGNQGRHGSTEVYEQWTNKFWDAECVKNPPKTQGIIELHQKSAKHITMNSKRERPDNVVSKYEEWEKVLITPWEGEHFLSSGEKINMYHTCAIDTTLQILLVFYSLNIEQNAEPV